MLCTVLASLMAGVAPADPPSAAPSLDFTRTYAANEKLTYSCVLKNKSLNIELDCVIRQSAQKKSSDAKPQLTLATTKYESSSPDVAIGDKPDDLTTTLGPNNMPENLQVKKLDYMNVFLLLASMTVGKTVEVGQEFPVSWSSKGGFIIGVKGTAKLAALDLAAKTAKVVWALALTINGVDGGNIVLNSVLDTANCSLMSCTGTALNGQFTIDLKRL